MYVLTRQENYGRSKETHAHTQALWEKEIRRARKETFKSQSAIVKLQEELKAARTNAKTAEESLAHEKERSKAREQEAFQARYELVGCQEELEQTLQKVKMLEQERDAFRSLAKSEEDVARIASEGRLPLPPPGPEEEEEEEPKEKEEQDDKHATADADADNMDETKDSCRGSDSESDDKILALPKQRSKRHSVKGRRVSQLHDIKSSAASETEIDELTRLWQWEKQRADRSSELVEYLEAECHLRACSCMKKRPRTSFLESARKRPALDLGDGGDRIILSEKAALASPTAKIRTSLSPRKLLPSALRATVEADPEKQGQKPCNDHAHDRSPKQSPKHKAPRLSTTVFIPEEGIFRTVSQQIAEEVEDAVSAAATAMIAAMPEEPIARDMFPTEEADILPTLGRDALPLENRPPAPADEDIQDIQDADMTVGDATTDTAATVETTEKSMYARTPSVEPPAFAQTRTSLLSLLDAPHRQEAEQPINFYVPTTPGPAAPNTHASSTRTATLIKDSNACMEIDLQDKHNNSNDDEDEQPARRAAASILVSSTSAHDMDDTEMGDEDDDDEITEEIEQSRVSDVTEMYGRSTQIQHEQEHLEEERELKQETMQAERKEAGHNENPVGRAKAQPYRYETPALEDPAPKRVLGRPHTVTGSALSTKTTTTTTKVPLREETTDPSLAQRILAAQRTPQNKKFTSSSRSDGGGDVNDGPSFDINNPALTPTMTREQCLAQIRERRGRARSATTGSSSSSGSRPQSGSGPSTSNGVTKPGSATGTGAVRRPVTPGTERREVSAPVRRMASGRRGRS